MGWHSQRQQGLARKIHLKALFELRNFKPEPIFPCPFTAGFAIAHYFSCTSLHFIPPLCILHSHLIKYKWCRAKLLKLCFAQNSHSMMITAMMMIVLMVMIVVIVMVAALHFCHYWCDMIGQPPPCSGPLWLCSYLRSPGGELFWKFQVL